MLVENAEEKVAALFIAKATFQKYIPLGIHSCRPHVCMAVNGWVDGKKRSPELKMLGDKFKGMIAYLADRMTSLESAREAMVLLAHMITFLRRKMLVLPEFDEQSPVHDHHDEVEWSQLASKVKDEFGKAALTLCIKTPEEMKELIDDEMKVNDTKSRQSFSGVQVTIDQLM